MVNSPQKMAQSNFCWENLVDKIFLPSLMFCYEKYVTHIFKNKIYSEEFCVMANNFVAIYYIYCSLFLLHYDTFICIDVVIFITLVLN